MRIVAFLMLVLLTGFVAGCGKTAPATNSGPTPEPDPKPKPQPNPTPNTASDKDRLQGVWAVESIESTDRKGTPPEMIKALRYQFIGDRLVVTSGEKIVDWVHSYTVDSSKNPKWLDVAMYNEKGEPAVSETFGSKGAVRTHIKGQWIYKFEGESLVLATTDHDHVGYRPPDFKPSAAPQPKLDENGKWVKPPNLGRPAVEIVHLKKTNETPLAAEQLPTLREFKP